MNSQKQELYKGVVLENIHSRYSTALGRLKGGE